MRLTSPSASQAASAASSPGAWIVIFSGEGKCLRPVSGSAVLPDCYQQGTNVNGNRNQQNYSLHNGTRQSWNWSGDPTSHQSGFGNSDLLAIGRRRVCDLG